MDSLSELVKNQITGVVDRIENDKIVIIFPSGEKINLPKTTIQSNLQEGEVVTITIQKESEVTNNKKDLAKAILNELLKTEK